MKGICIMNSFIRAFYETDLCEAAKPFEMSEEARSASISCERIHKKLMETLSEENAALLEEYFDTNNIVRDDEIFHAYCCGIRDIVRFAAGAFIE